MVNQKIAALAVEYGGRLGKSLLSLKPNNIAGAKGLRYMPEKLMTDVVEITQKAENVLLADIERIAELRKSGMTQTDIANKYGVTRSAVQQFLYKWLPGVNKDSIELRNAIKGYMSASSQAEKDKAFTVIDKYLQNIAKTKAKETPGATFEDTLQDLRLTFFEEMSKPGNPKDKGHLESVLKTLKGVEPELQNKPGIVYIEEAIEEVAGNSSISDPLIETFEKKDFCSALINSGRPAKRKDFFMCSLHPRERYILEEYFFGNKSLEEIGNYLHLTDERVRVIMVEACERLKKNANYI